MIGPLAERAINRALVHSLEQRIAESDATWRTRCEAAYVAGLHRGRAGITLAFVIGGGIGAGVLGLLLVLAT